MPKKKQSKSPFEESVDRLESIVNLMEEEHLPLEALLTNYEEGQELLSHCQSLIDNARERIEVVQLSAQSTQDKAENKLASTSSSSDTPSSEAPSDDNRLL